MQSGKGWKGRGVNSANSGGGGGSEILLVGKFFTW